MSTATSIIEYHDPGHTAAADPPPSTDSAPVLQDNAAGSFAEEDGQPEPVEGLQGISVITKARGKRSTATVRPSRFFYEILLTRCRTSL